MLTQALLLSVLDYNPKTGMFIWRDRPADPGWTKKNSGKQAGWVDVSTGYVRIRIFSRDYGAHRLAVLYMTGEWPTHEVDHRDTNRANNRWANLRPATHTQNGHNAGLRRNNRSGIKGVSWDTIRGKWHASICIDGKMKGLGRFDTLEQAATARAIAEAEYHGDFAHTKGTC